LIDSNGDISVISENAITYLCPYTGVQFNREVLQQSMGVKADFMVVNTEVTDTKTDNVIVSIPRDQQNEYFKVQVYPQGKKLDGTDEPLFFTQVDKKSGKMSGYRINRHTLACT